MLKTCGWLFVVAASIAVGGIPLSSQSRTESNVVYGMYSGLALLMDVHYPASPNGRGVIFVAGSAFSAPLGFDAPPLKQNESSLAYAKALTGAGYTVFSVNHRAAPRFQYPAAVEDVQRAVRFIRANAPAYRIDPSQIGAVGGSSGGHLVGMLGVLDGAGEPDDVDPVNRVSAKVQAVAAVFAPFDLTLQFKHSSFLGRPEAMFVGSGLRDGLSTASPEYKRMIAASPITYVTQGDAPFLLLHGDNDALVPLVHSTRMLTALQAAKVEAKLVTIKEGGHGTYFGFKPGDPRLLDHFGEIARWLDQHLVTKKK